MRSVKILGVLMFASQLASAASATATSVDRHAMADAKGSVEISNVSGEINVTGWDKNEVDIKGTLGAAVERLDFLRDGNRIIIKVILPKVSYKSDSSAKLNIRITAASTLDVTTVSADIANSGVSGEQRLKSVSGDVATQLAQTDVDIKTVSGDVRLTGQSSEISTRVNTVSGDISINGGAGNLDISTVSGDLHADMKTVGSMRMRSTSGDAIVSGRWKAAGRVDFETVSGDLKLSGPADGGMTIDLDSFSGDISTCFNAPVEKAKYGSSESLRTKIGGGSVQLRAKTLSGDVSVCDR